ncbi:MAG: stealth conserved region 3 domain-containing protein [Micropruina sp.]|nr:stealth conserved region 3 domain-containing protein [Micropruina sp.]
MEVMGVGVGSARKGDRKPSTGRAHVGFILTAPYQLFHYGAIREHLGNDVSVYVEVREDDFGVTRSIVERHMAPCRVVWVASHDLADIDGTCDVVVCQTPIPVMKFFSRSKVVAQQYSLAKEQYQYGVWRSQADLNLMYGPYSASVPAPFSATVAVGNPLFDGHVPVDETLAMNSPGASGLRVLYMPTYGDLSNRERVLEELRAEGHHLSIKAHHADFEIKRLADRHGIPVHLSDTNPIGLIRDSDLVVSDYSGAIFDALAMRTPVALVESVNNHSKDLGRLSGEDLSRTHVTALASIWNLGTPLGRAHDRSRERLSDDSVYRAFLDHLYVNLGHAGSACATAIETVADTGPKLGFAATLVRDTTRDYIERNRALRARVAQLERGRAWPALRAALRRDSPWVVAKKSARLVLREFPRGLQVAKGLRNTAARYRWKTQQRSKDVTPAASHANDRSGLSPLPHVRRVQMMELLHASLSAAGVDHRARSTDHWAYIAVRQEDLDSLYRALRSLSHDNDLRFKFWLGTGAKYSTARNAAALSLHDLAASESVVVGVPFKMGQYSIDRNGGAEILILARRENRLVARLKRADKVDWTIEFATPAQASVTVREPQDIREKTGPDYVDVVYTWVDSSDVEWSRQRAQWSGQTEIVMASAANDERYLDRDELRYSLRSVMMYAPFVRNIYIVTHGHRPSWLVDDDRIRVVPHHEIFPDPSVLPTFNSHAIEACLHRIPGLAENFLYFNDDVFLGRDATFHDFYTKAGLIKSRFSPSSFVAETEPAPDAIPTDWASYNAVKLMRDEFGMGFDRKLKHVPHPLKRSLLEELEQRYPEVFKRTRASRFREPSDYSIPSMLAHYYGIATHRAVEWDDIAKDYVYADTGRADFQVRLDQVLAKKPMFVCLNVTLHSDIDFATQARLLRAFLSQRYPIASPFEQMPPENTG